MTDRTGQQLGHYRLLRKLGSGGFADVYQAEHIYLNTPAAVKLLNTSLMSGEIRSFHNEARTIARLIHPHIVRVLDFGLEENIPYLVMEYAPGGTLRQRHPKRTVVPLPVIVKYVRQVASALQYAHTNRLIHRDVKPENILLGNDNRLLLGDFGAALLASTSLMFSTQNIIGTVAYMAPEQLRGKPVPASDQYALGIVVYEWLCGQCPFQGSLAELNNLHFYQLPPSLCARIPALSPLVEQVVMKALAKQSEQRYPTIWDFALALEQAGQQAQASASPLFLAGNGSSHNQVTMFAAAAPLAPAPSPVATPQVVPTVAVENSVSGSRSGQSRLSRRVFVGSIIGLAAIGSGGALGWWLTNQGNSQATSTPPGPHRTPTPKATPVPTKSDALYVYRGHRDYVFSAAWSPGDNDTYIASAGGNATSKNADTGVHVWEARTGQVAYLYLGHSKLVRMVAWSPNGSRIASASEDKTVQVWDAFTGNNIIVYANHAHKVFSVAWSPDGTRIVSSSQGTADKNVQVWDANNGTFMFSYPGHNSDVTSVAWSPNGTLIASASIDGMVNIWDAQTGKTQYSFTQKALVGSLAWSPDSTSLVTGDYNPDDRVRVWDLSKQDFTWASPGTSQDQVYTVAYSPDSRYIAAGYQDSSVKIWQYGTGKQVLTYTGHSQPIMSVQWSHNGTYVVSCGFDNTVRIWTIS